MMQILAKRGRQLLAASLFLTSLSLGGTPLPVAAQSAGQDVQFSLSQARVVARQALQQGNLQLADVLSSALLEANPNDADALLIRALIARGVGDLDAAAENGAAAYRNAPNDDMKFDAAMLTADILARQEKFSRAQLWLRRADQVATTDQRRALASRSYRQVAARNPLQVQLGFTIRPNNNVNNGSEEEVTSGGLTGSGEDPLSGTEISGSFALKYRLAENPESRTDLFVNGFARVVDLESGFAEIVPGTTSREFDFASLSLGVEHRRLLFPELGVTTFRAAYGGGYFRNEHYLSFAEAGATQDFKLDDKRTVRTGLKFRDDHRLDSPAASSFNTAVSLDYFDSTPETWSWSVGTTVTNYNSQAPTVEGKRVDLRGRVAFSEGFFGATPDISLTLSWRDLPDFLFGDVGADGRQDVSGSLRLGLTYQDVSFYGFQPRLELGISKTNAEFDLFDSESISLGLTAVSRF